MRTRGAVIRQAPGKWEVVDLEVDDPREDEVQVQLVAAGMCHSDDHVAKGDMPVGIYPWAGGHEGAGIVTKARRNRKGIKEGDRIVFTFLPSCGYCRWCSTGQSNLCDLSANLLAGSRWDDPTDFRLKMADTREPVGQYCSISTFVETTTVAADSCIRVPDDVPLDVACLTGCGVGTGWGSAVNNAHVRPGHTVIVMGVGGIGINAVQGAKHAGATTIIAVDPVPFKRQMALELGATHAYDSMEEAHELARQFTNGQGADSAIVTVGLTRPAHVAQAFSTIRKAGICVVTGLGPLTDFGLPISISELTFYQKRIEGSSFGGCNPNWDIPRQLEMYRAGVLKLDELITTRYSLDDIVQGFDDLLGGKNIRGVIDFPQT
jgi:S-(hydroxymethyl)glutathione dehydrogenase/alcohol dehydrogenase